MRDFRLGVIRLYLVPAVAGALAGAASAAGNVVTMVVLSALAAGCLYVSVRSEQNVRAARLAAESA